MENVLSRMLQYLESKKISRYRCEHDLHLGKGYLSKKDIDPTTGVIVKFLTAYPDVSLLWLILEEGPMLLAEKEITHRTLTRELLLAYSSIRDKEKIIASMQQKINFLEKKLASDVTK